MASRPAAVFVSFAVPLVAGLVGCSATTDEAAPVTEATTGATPTPTAAPEPTPTTEPTATPVPSPTPEPAAELARVLADAYAEAFDTFYAVLDPPNADDPRIDAQYAGDPRQELFSLIAELTANGEVARLPDPTVATTTFVIVDQPGEGVVFGVGCIVDDGYTENAATGARRNDAVSTATYDVTFRLEDGYWRLAQETQTGYELGVSSC